MLPISGRFAWLRSGLYWRTFFILACLIAASMAVWVESFRIVERTPRAEQIAAQIASIVTITRSALLHSAPGQRRELLFDLASNEGIRVYPRESTDKITPPEDSTLMPLVQEALRSRLGIETRFAGTVNDIPGFWISFTIDDDDYWLTLDRERVERTSGIQWLGWVAATLLLSLLVAALISRLINLPLARLTQATRAIGRGQQPDPLPERGPTEIREANSSFNQMVLDLKRVESDRALILAGISHDLRTPISRMLLEVEMADLPPEARSGMQSDLAQMDAIIGQFLDYAKPANSERFVAVDLSGMVVDVSRETARLPDVEITNDIAAEIEVLGNPIDLRRLINNLVENARRYGKTPGSDQAQIHIRCRREGDRAMLEVGDHGSGVPESEMDYLLRPFTRRDSARSQANGAGLGLAIVKRVVQRHGATLSLSNREGGGLIIRIFFPPLATVKHGFSAGTAA
ncbi:sensor histidine kinase [Noviherbaspirillum pedocola]|uniref:histidine kinase n=1 Tax=Noviherbaspirillum pedocola TaxID=2801341 RepID=A0A934ST04_9BURK|nr:sensor histidine kinase [Noviherbaspirillum pedocola]MBK4736231.1 HAMP domain-containing protein [Noviherbaspirillum pedocola]